MVKYTLDNIDGLKIMQHGKTYTINKKLGGIIRDEDGFLIDYKKTWNHVVLLLNNNRVKVIIKTIELW